MPLSVSTSDRAEAVYVGGEVCHDRCSEQPREYVHWDGWGGCGGVTGIKRLSCHVLLLSEEKLKTPDHLKCVLAAHAWMCLCGWTWSARVDAVLDHASTHTQRASTGVVVEIVRFTHSRFLHPCPQARTHPNLPPRMWRDGAREGGRSSVERAARHVRPGETGASSIV